MLRLTTVSRSASQAVLQVVGWVVGDDVSLLEHEIERKLQGSQRLVLDLDGTRAIDASGLAMLARWAPQRVQLQGGSAFLRALLETRGLVTATASPRPPHDTSPIPRKGDP